MARGTMRGQAILAVMILAAATTACGQFGNLKARKHLKDANALYAQADYRQAAVERGGHQVRPGHDPGLLLSRQQLRQHVYSRRAGRSRKRRAAAEGGQEHEIAVQREIDPQRRSSRSMPRRQLRHGQAERPSKAEPVVQQMIQDGPEGHRLLLHVSPSCMKTRAASRKRKRRSSRRATPPRVTPRSISARGLLQQARSVREGGGDARRARQLDPNNPEAF